MKTIVAIFLFMLFPLTVSAQILYTDISPDTLLADDNITPGQYQLDLDSDGSVDFFFMHFFYPVPVYVLSIYTQYNQPHEILVDMDNRVTALERGDPIDESRTTWLCTAEGGQSAGLSFASGWRGTGDRFIGLRVFDGQGWRYGWLQAQLPADESWILLKAYAVQMTSGTTINAGDTGLNSVQQPPVSSRLRIRVDGRFVEVDAERPRMLNVTVYDVIGNARLQRNTFGDRMSVDLSALPQGVYFLRAHDGREVSIQRLMLYERR